MTDKAPIRYTQARGGGSGETLVAARTVRAASQRARNVRVNGAVAKAEFPLLSPHSAVLLDPDKPTVDANVLLKERGGKMLDPALINHNCPFCKKTLAWDLFKAHMRPCVTRWFNTVDVTHRRFAGGGPNA